MIWSTWGRRLVALPGASAFTTFLIAAGLIREKLTANRTYYVRTDGSNSNTGLVDSSGGAFLTWQKAWDTVVSTIDTAGYTVTIKIADGTYTAGITCVAPWSGGGPIIIEGNTTTPDNCLMNAATRLFNNNGAALPARVTIKGFKHTGASQSLLMNGSGILRFQSINFGSTGFAHIQCNSDAAVIEIGGNYSITAGATYHIYMARHSAVLIPSGVTFTCTVTGTMTFSGAFVLASIGANIEYQSSLATIDISGATVTGVRYSANTNGLIITGGAGASFFPGGTAGSTATQGQYT